MQPLNWDTASRTPPTDSISLFVLPDASRHPPSESFGSHLHHSDSAPPAATPHASESSRPDWRAEQQPQSAPPVPSRNPATQPERHASSPAEPAGSAAQDPAQPAGSDARPADPQDDLAQSPSSESAASDDESEGRPAHAAKRDDKLSAATRAKTGSRHSETATNGDGEFTNAPADTETRAATKKRVAPLSGKSKGVAKSQQNGRAPESGQPETVAPPETNDKLREADVTKRTGLSPDGEAAGQFSADSATDRSLTAIEQSSTNDAVDVPSRQPNTGTISSDPSTLVPNSDVDRATRVGKRGNRGSRDERGDDALAAAGSLSPAERAPETTAGRKQLDESIALGELPGGPVATESATVPSPATSAPHGSTPIAPHMRFAQHLAVKPGERATRTSPFTDLEHARLVDRVARAFQAAEARGGTVTLRLHPPELGALRLELRVIEGALSARLEAETPAARTVLLDNVQMLHDRLAEQGVRIERFDVDLLDRRSSGDAPAFEHNSPRDQEARRQPPTDPSGRDLRESDSIRPDPRSIATGQLNVVV